MSMKLCHGGLAASLLLGLSLPALAATSPAASDGNVPYVTGGVGIDESTQLLNERSRHPLAVEVYAKDGAHEVYTAGADVVVRRSDGERVLEATAEGPFLFADVPSGRYDVAVTEGGRTVHRPVVVKDGRTARAVFVFDAA